MNGVRKRVYVVIWVIIILLGIHILSRSFTLLSASSLPNRLISQGEHYLGVSVIKTYFPGILIFTEYKEEKEIGEKIVEKALGDSPIYKFMKENESQVTEIEDADSYAMIIAKEAADENYVDELTGEVIFTESEQLLESESEPEAVNETSSEAVIANVEGTTGPQAPIEFSLDKLKDFDYLLSTFYNVDRTTTINSTKLNVETLLNQNLTISAESAGPQILIYHTHSQEGFVDSVPGVLDTTIVGVGDYLTKILQENYGYEVIHHRGVYDIINGKLDRNQAYTLAEPDIKAILAENPSIQVVLDLHRDGVREDVRLVTDVGGKPTAKFMFFNGLSYTTQSGEISYLHNPYLQDNLAFSLQLQLKAASYYPGLTRKIYLKGWRYNLHLCPRSVLVEVGAQTNTLQEGKNAMEPLADILHKVLSGN